MKEKKKVEAILKDFSFADSVLVTILNSIFDGIYVVDKDRRIIFWNRGAEEITGFSAAEVMGKRFYSENLYASDPGKGREKIEKCIKDNPDKNLDVVLWGVGNHGGGPSRTDIRRINQLIRQSKNLKILHSTPEAYFKDLRREKDKLPKHKDDINPGLNHSPDISQRNTPRGLNLGTTGD